MKIRVYFEDTDIGGIVYHTKYINFCERARSEILFKNGLKPFNKDSNSGYIVSSLNCKFLKSATLGDILEVKSKLLNRSKVKFTLLQEIFKDDCKIFSMEVEIVYIKNGKPSKLDNKFLELFNSL
jgi:acyl-CoA thioester hydrolase